MEQSGDHEWTLLHPQVDFFLPPCVTLLNRLDTTAGVFANCLEDYQPRRLGVRETADSELEKLRTVLDEVEYVFQRVQETTFCS